MTSRLRFLLIGIFVAQAAAQPVAAQAAPPPRAVLTAFGKASFVVEGAVVDASVWTHSGRKLYTIPDILPKRRQLRLTLHVTRDLRNTNLSGDLSVRMESPGLNIPLFLLKLTQGQLIYFLKEDLQFPDLRVYYPSDQRLFYTSIDNEKGVNRLIERRRNSTQPPNFARNYYRVPGTVPVIVKYGSQGCWAAAAAMLLSWRDMRTYTNQEAAKMAGNDFTQLLSDRHHNAIDPKKKGQVLSRLGMIAEAPQTFMPNGIRELLEENGPLWVTINMSGSDVDFMLTHAWVIVAIEGDDTSEGTKLTYIDPNDGLEKQSKFQDFTASYESVAVADYRAKPRAAQPFQAQIIHF